MTEDEKQRSKLGGVPGILNVFFHGTFVFDFHENDRNIDVLIPHVEDHVYRVGSWLGETELMCQEGHHDDAVELYELKGVERGFAGTLPLQHNLMFRQKQLPSDVDALLYAKIRVPFPESIATPRRALLPSNSYRDPQSVLKEIGYLGQIGSIQIFTYRFQSDNELSLTCHPSHPLWEPAFAGGAISLHIFAAPEHFYMPPNGPQPVSHVRNAFKQCMEVLGLDLEMNDLPEKNEFDERDVPEGAVPEETEDLAPRVRRLSQLGRMRKDNRDLNQLWYSSEALDGDPDACGSAGNTPPPPH